MPVSLADSIEGYAEALDFVERYSEAVEVTTLLSLRDGIALDLSQGAALDERLRCRLREADKRLLAAAPGLARRFPDFNFAASVQELVGNREPDPTAARTTA